MIDFAINHLILYTILVLAIGFCVGYSLCDVERSEADLERAARELREEFGDALIKRKAETDQHSPEGPGQ